MTAKERRAELKAVELNSVVSPNQETHILRRHAASAINSPIGLRAGDRIDLAIFGIATGIYDNQLIYKAMETGRYRLLRVSGLYSLLFAGRNAIALLPGAGIAIRNSFGFDDYTITFGVKKDVHGRMNAYVDSKDLPYASYTTLLSLEARKAHAPYMFFDITQEAPGGCGITARCGNATLNVERGTALKRETVNYSNITEKTGGVELRIGDNVWLTEIPRARFTVLPARIDGLPATFIMAR